MSSISDKPVNNEENEKIDFSKMSKDELLDQFKSENFSQLKTDEEKLDLLQEVENRNAQLNGREPATVVQTNDPSLLGGYSASGHTIYININDNSYENLDSIIHEGEHANNAYSTTNASHISVDDKNLISLEHYQSVDPSQSHYGYYQQANNQDLYNIYSSELNSNNRAFTTLANEADRYGTDPNYVAYLQGRNDHYNTVADELSTMSNDKKAAYLETAKVNYERGLLTQAQYNSIEKSISSKEYTDSFEKTALDNHNLLNNMVIDEENHTLISLNNNEENTNMNEEVNEINEEEDYTDEVDTSNFTNEIDNTDEQSVDLDNDNDDDNDDGNDLE
ncbi:MAG: hypothetical protein LUH02_09610 [Erysipelotrichaceae bacterium]|nr:hypothetical protein [Erysipelotrichaceae bacterium]